MSTQNIIGSALTPMMEKSKNDDSDEEGAIIGPALPPKYKASESSSSCEDSDQEEVVFKRAKYSSSSSSSSSSRNRPSSNRSNVKDEIDIKQVDKDEEEDDDGFFGPALPPGYQKRDKSPKGPPLLGPALPPGFKKQEDDDDDDDDEDAEDDTRGFLGPALPPGYQKLDRSPERPPVGPALPPGFKRQDADEDEEEGKRDAREFLLPALPPGYTPAESSGEEEDDDYVIGPMPSKGPSQDSVALDIERRAQRMKDKLTGVDTGSKVLRESWMTELPPELQHVGLEARTFKKRSGPENKDRSIWTDTPADRERKARERLEAKEKGESAKDDGPCLSHKELEMAEKVSKYNESKRGESLISMHTKKIKRKAEEDASKPVERRPFDRDADLQVNRFDEAQKKALLKKSQELNTRFSHSKDRMFL
ncbi:GPALPP motifs-containing protein 1-like isoform X3 [Sinocyclocheilus rhinocerous]|uniref:GPALPP motifs-containing protein 1-like isoform X3 n=1 Tax=Sinocyclocheilus rhinocerous TaxID=307959 RepID=UPI0007B917F9|nr:PREDICTED: GPALPP motifs-containing protein 1-like isoform X3 [Sinocyclocheilus rhinocerous]